MIVRSLLNIFFAAVDIFPPTLYKRGQTLQLIIAGQLVGFHVVQEAITNGVVAFVLANNLPEENAMMLYRELTQSITHLQLELKEQQG